MLNLVLLLVTSTATVFFFPVSELPVIASPQFRFTDDKVFLVPAVACVLVVSVKVFLFALRPMMVSLVPLLLPGPVLVPLFVLVPLLVSLLPSARVGALLIPVISIVLKALALVKLCVPRAVQRRHRFIPSATEIVKVLFVFRPWPSVSGAWLPSFLMVSVVFFLVVHPDSVKVQKYMPASTSFFLRMPFKDV
jgi:hypothetical protein